MKFDGFNRRFRVQRVSETANDFGDMVKTWTDIVVLWGRKNVAAGSESMEVGESVRRQRFEVHTRFYPGITNKDRLVDQVSGAVLNIDAVTDRDGVLEELVFNLMDAGEVATGSGSGTGSGTGSGSGTGTGS